MRNVKDAGGGINSVFPCTEYLTFGPWIYMVPQYTPESVLMLGYAGGTTAGLIKLIHGDVPITAVDVEFVEDPYGVEFVLGDAREYVKDCPHFDCIIVDVFDPVDPSPPDFVFSDEFVADVTAKCNYLIVDAMEDSDMSAYDHLHRVKTLALNRSRFHYFMVNRVARLPIR